MALLNTAWFQSFHSPVKDNSFKFTPFAEVAARPPKKPSNSKVSSSRMECLCLLSINISRLPLLGAHTSFRRSRLRVSRRETYQSDDGNKDRGETESDDENGPLLMDKEERQEWRRKIREVIDRTPDVEEEIDPVERKKKMEKLMADYPLVVDEEDPEWPEDADGRGFKLDQFFDKITIKNVKKDDDDDDDDDSKNEVVWQDDDYIRPIKDITTAEWEETVFKDFSPLIVLVHNRYKRPKENERIRDELEKAVHIIWNCRLPSPRCVAIDAVVELDLVSALRVSVFPEIIFTKAGKILYREKVIRSADEFSKIMAFFYYGAAKPPCLKNTGNSHEEAIPSVLNNSGR